MLVRSGRGQKGQLLVELMLALGVVVIALSIGAQFIYLSLRAHKIAAERDVATGISKEQLDGIRSVAVQRWEEINGKTKNTAQYYAVLTSGSWTISSGVSGPTSVNGVNYYTAFTIQNICRAASGGGITGVTDSDGTTTTCTTLFGQLGNVLFDQSTQKINISVWWGQETPTANQVVSTTDYVNRWQNVACAQTDWSGGADIGSARSCVNNIYYDSQIGITGALTKYASYSSGAVGTSNSPIIPATGDFNNDGKKDVIVSNGPSGVANTVSLFLGNGDGSLQIASSISVGNDPYGVVAFDFNADGKLDFAAANRSSNTISVRLGNGDGTFAAAASYATGTQPTGLVTADFNSDGIGDLAYTNYISNNMSVRLGAANGTFGAATTTATGTNPYGIVAGDFNADGKQDLVAANSGSNTVSFFSGNGAGLFAAGVTFSVGTAPVWLDTGDLNADNKADLVVPNFTSNTFSVLIGNGAGSFASAVNYPVLAAPWSLSVRDVNNDNKLDVVVANQASGKLTVSLGTGTGAFGGPRVLDTAAGPTGVLASDLNGDGNLDLITGNFSAHDLTVALGNGDGTFGAIQWSAFMPTVSAQTTAVQSASGQQQAPFDVVTADFNGDGMQDVAATQAGNLPILSISFGNGDGTFTLPMTYTLGITPQFISVADFNNDNKPDIILSRGATTTNVYLFLNNGAGYFGTPTISSFAFGSVAKDIAVGDFNADGKQDFLLAGSSLNTVSIYLGNGAGTFSNGPGSPITLASSPYLLDVGDFNGDSKTDFLAVSQLNHKVFVYTGDGAGGFTQASGSPVDPLSGVSGTLTNVFGPSGITVADFDGDGKKDFATTINYTDASSIHDVVAVMRGDGSGGFTQTSGSPMSSGSCASGCGALGVIAADFTNDNKQDIVTANSGSANFSFLSGNGDGTFATAQSVSGAVPQFLSVADFNGDGNKDFVASAFWSASVPPALDRVWVALGFGDGQFGHKLVSNVYDAATNADGVEFNTFLWKGKENGGVFKFQIATSPNANGPWVFHGPACTTFAFDTYTAKPQTPVTLGCSNIHAGKRYLKYQIFLTTTQSRTQPAGPRVDDILLTLAP